MSEDSKPAVAYVKEEWGIERTLPNWNDGKPYIEWGGWQGHDGYSVTYTAESVWGLSSGRPVYRRYRTVYKEELTEPELVNRSDQ